MDEILATVLQEIRRRCGFPPQRQVQETKEKLNVRGLLHSGITSQSIATAYTDCIQKIVDEFLETLFKNSAKLNLNSDQHFLDPANEALMSLFSEATGRISQDIPWGKDFQALAIRALEDKRSSFIDQITARVKLRDLDMNRGEAMSSINISRSQNVNVTVGSVNTSIQQVIQRGGQEEQAGRILEKLVETIARLGEDRRAEQSELYDLIKGLTQQIKLPKEERSVSTVRAIFDRIIDIAKVSIELTQFLNQNLPQLLALLNIRQ